MGKDVEAAAEVGEFTAKDYKDPLPAPLIDVEELGKWSLYRAVVAVFIATLLFLYITVTTVIGYKHRSDPNVGGTDTAGRGVGILRIAWAFGGMIFVLVYRTAGISGDPMVAYDPAERLLHGKAPADYTIRRKMLVVAMFALCVAFGGFVLDGPPSSLIYQKMTLMANFTVFILGLLVIYSFKPIPTGIPGLPISADRLVSVTLAVSVATLFLNSTCLILVAG